MAGESAEPAAERLEPLVVEAGGADDGVDAVVDAEAEVVHDDVGMGEVDDRLGAGLAQQPDRVVLVDAGHQLEVGGRLHRPAHLRADLALRPEDAHLDRVAHGPQPIAGGAAEVSPLTPTSR